MHILQASTPEQLDQVRELLRDYVEGARTRYADYLAAIDTYFDKDRYSTEIDSLPGDYALPEGCLLLAVDEAQAAGCVALHRIDSSTCEMKRMFVRPEFRGRGIGRALAQRLISESKQIGYTCMLLETGPLQVEALTLYRSLGFTDVAPYYPVPEVFHDKMIFMMLEFS